MLKKTADQHTALLYFTLSASEEARVKRFTRAKNFSANKLVAQKLISDTYNTITDAGLPVFTFSSNQQVGDSFGERFANAFATLFEAGYENVIAVGNDCPRLSSAEIAKANNQLLHNSYVIGPATDGGTYLIGVNRQAFDKQKFSSLSWETNQLLTDLIDLTKNFQYSFKLLRELADIDNSGDLFSVIRRLKQSSVFYFRVFADALSALINAACTRFVPYYPFHNDLEFIGSSFSHRGPPLRS